MQRFSIPVSPVDMATHLQKYFFGNILDRPGAVHVELGHGSFPGVGEGHRRDG